MSFGQVIAAIPTAGTQYNTYTTAKSMLGSATATAASAGIITLTPQQLIYGSTIEIDALLAISNRVTGPDTFTIEVRVGPTSNIVGFTTGAITLTTTAHTNIPCWVNIKLQTQAMGGGTLTQFKGIATLTGQMIQQGGTAGADSATLSNTIIMPNTAPALGTGFDGGAANILDFYVAQSVSNAGNGCRVDTYSVKYWGPGGW